MHTAILMLGALALGYLIGRYGFLGALHETHVALDSAREELANLKARLNAAGGK